MTLTKDQSKEIVDDLFIEIFNRKNFDLVDKLYTKHAILYGENEEFVGSEAIKKLVIRRSKAIPDLHFIIEDTIIEGDKTAIRWRAAGKALSNFAGFKAGHSLNYWGTTMWEVDTEGKIEKTWFNSSLLDIAST